MSRSWVAVVVVVVACTKTGQPEVQPSASAPSASAAAAATPAVTASAPPSSTCDGLDKTPCVLHPGCILDQPPAGGYLCREAKNDCERAVRHADVIGVDVKGVTAAEASAAPGKCTRTPGCVVAGGKCSCPCHVFGGCDCSCGGGWLSRCVPKAEAASLDGFPTKH